MFFFGLRLLLLLQLLFLLLLLFLDVINKLLLVIIDFAQVFVYVLIFVHQFLDTIYSVIVHQNTIESSSAILLTLLGLC